MTAPQATPACAIGLPGSFTGVSELEVPHAVAGPIAARNDLARCGPLQRQRFWRRRGQPRPDLGLVIRMTGIVAPADKFALELRLEGRVRPSAGQGPGGCRNPAGAPAKQCVRLPPNRDSLRRRSATRRDRTSRSDPVGFLSCSVLSPSSLAIEPCVRRTCVLALTSRHFSPHLVGWLVLRRPM
jgi:hypothetical protein